MEIERNEYRKKYYELKSQFQHYLKEQSANKQSEL